MEEQQKLIKALIEKPSIYKIDVLDNSMLPKELSNEKHISFTVKPPTIEVLSLCAGPTMRLPAPILNKTNVSFETAIEYRETLAEIIVLFAHAKVTPYPEWHIEFLLKNLTPNELFQIFIETYSKCQTDFFLSCFQIAGQSNPMMINRNKQR